MTLEPLGSQTRKQLTALAYDNARLAVANENYDRHFIDGEAQMTQNEARQFFKDHFILELEKIMTAVYVSNGPCLGSIGTARPLANLGICLAMPCKC